MRSLTYSNVASTLALVLVVAAGAPALADSISEPDAYAVRVHADALQAQVDSLADANAAMAVRVDDLVASANDQADAIDELGASAAATDCLAISDRHYVRETINGSKRRYRMPLVVWRLDVKSCRPDSGPWQHRRLTR